MTSSIYITTKMSPAVRGLVIVTSTRIYIWKINSASPIVKTTEVGYTARIHITKETTPATRMIIAIA